MQERVGQIIGALLVVMLLWAAVKIVPMVRRNYIVDGVVLSCTLMAANRPESEDPQRDARECVRRKMATENVQDVLQRALTATVEGGVVFVANKAGAEEFIAARRPRGPLAPPAGSARVEDGVSMQLAEDRAIGELTYIEVAKLPFVRYAIPFIYTIRKEAPLR